MGDRYGQALAFAGDLDQDGFPEVLVGAPGLSAGRVEVLSPRVQGVLWGTEGLNSQDAFGTSLARGGDVDADGRPEIYVGAPRGDSLCT